MKRYKLPKDIYKSLVVIILIEVLFLNTLAYVFRLYHSPALWPMLILFVLFNTIIGVLFRRIAILQKKLFNTEIEVERCHYIQEEIKTYRKHRHDMKNHLMILHELARQGQVQELQAYADQYGHDAIDHSLIQVHTGIEELDILLYSKMEQCRHNSIAIEYTCNTNLLVKPKWVPALVSLFGNLLDNAIDAANEIEDPLARLIIFYLSEDPLDYVLVLTNTFPSQSTPNVKRMFREGYSQKSPDRGRGLSIVQNITGKLEGHLKVDLYQEQFFQVRLELPKHRLC